MRIIYPVLWARPGRKACQAQTISTANALARQGHQVTLLVPQSADDPQLGAADLREWFGVDGDLRVVQRPSRWAGERVDRTVMWLRQVFHDPETLSADLLYSRIPAMVALGGFSPIPFATDHYRPWPDVYPAVRPLVRRTAQQRHCVGLVLHSDYAAKAYRRCGVPENKLLVAHNGFDPSSERPGKDAARERLGLIQGRPIVVYAGRINQAKGLETVLAMADLRPEILFVLVGSEGEGPVERAASRRANVRVFPWADQTQLSCWLAAADVLIIPPSRAPLERFGNCVLPIKLFAYLAAGRPILAPRAPDTAELLSHGKTAWLVEPDQPDDAALGLDRLLHDPPLCKALSDQALQTSENLTWDRRGERISTFLQSETGMADHGRSSAAFAWAAPLDGTAG